MYMNNAFVDFAVPPTTGVSTALTSVTPKTLQLAFSLRKLNASYTGPLIQLTRSTDSAVKDFPPDADGFLDNASITTWLAGATGSVSIWYNQGVGGSNAANVTRVNQPTLSYLTGLPSLVFNGSQFLTVPQSITTVTNNGVNGTILIVASATNRNQTTFGAINASSRWSFHINWSDGGCYFDTGPCCQSARNFANANVDITAQYTFIRRTTTQESRKRGSLRVSGTVTGSCSASTGFGIGYAVGDASYFGGTISEVIVVNTDLSGTTLTDIEADQMTYWSC